MIKDENRQILLEEIKHHLLSIVKEINKDDQMYFPYLLEQYAFLSKYFTLLKKSERLQVDKKKSIQ